MKPDFLPFCPRRLINLADMKSFGIGKVIVAESVCHTFYEHAIVAAEESNQAGVIGESDLKKVLDNLEPIESLCKTYDLKGTLRSVLQFKHTLTEAGMPLFHHAIAHGFDTIHKNLLADLYPLQVAFIPFTRTEFFEKEKLFDERVFERFKNARYDITEAGNCLATGANTACVFHLMRAAEHALRSLAPKMHVTSVNKNTPIEEATWGQMIVKFNEEIGIAKNHATPKQEAKLDAYLHLVTVCKALKHLWRDPVSHVRGKYDEEKAMDIFKQVRVFMQNACTVLSSRR